MTFDAPAAGVVVAQPERGFRYAVDVFWLVGFALAQAPSPLPPGLRAIDLGTGSGIAALLLAARGIPCVGVDVRPEWTALWAESLARSSVVAPVSLRVADVADVAALGGPYGLAVCNPPYFTASDGPGAPDPWKRAARTESTADLAGFVRAAVAVVPDGPACFVVPRDRDEELVAIGAALGRAPIGWARIGRRRSVVALGAGPAVPAEQLGPDDPRVLGWIARARGEPVTDPR